MIRLGLFSGEESGHAEAGAPQTLRVAGGEQVALRRGGGHRPYLGRVWQHGHAANVVGLLAKLNPVNLCARAAEQRRQRQNGSIRNRELPIMHMRRAFGSKSNELGMRCAPRSSRGRCWCRQKSGDAPCRRSVRPGNEPVCRTRSDGRRVDGGEGVSTGQL